MSDPGARLLLKLGNALSDGGSVDWDAELKKTPRLASRLKRLQELEALGNTYRRITASDPAADAGRLASEQRRFRWGPLDVLEQVGQGSFGKVYRAIDVRLHREVALKLRRIETAARGASARRFLDEARSLARVRHPNVVVVHGADVHQDQVGFWTEFIHGKTLAARLAEEGNMGVEEATLVGLDLCRALGAVHAAGLVHGDVKTANAMREQSGKIVLMDFGAVRGWMETGADGAAIGSPLSMAPEILEGGSPLPTSDLYSLAVVLYQLVSGRYPLVAENLNELRRRHETGDRTPLGDLRPDLSPAFVAVIERALDRDPNLRYQTAAEMESALLGSMGSPVARRHTLPAEPDALIGREEDLAELKRKFEEGSRLLTLLGAAGMGKTRLAVRWGWRSLDSWPGGVWFCDLSDASNLDGIVSAVAGSLEASLGKSDPVEQLGHAIAGRRRCLVILDNFEQVADLAPATLGRWLERAAEARFLITSRERLNLRGETIHVVEPLPVESGTTLFLERARRQSPGFVDVGSAGPAVREIVRLVDGIPLAIELAAARVRVMTPEQMVARMRDRFRLLSGGDEGSRHATLRAAIDGSWELLEPWEKAAIAQCSVFQGGFTLEAAEAVLDLGAWTEAPWVVDVMQSLVDKSLLRALERTGSQDSEPGVRFTMYVSLQDYARLKLREEDAVPGGGSGVEAERLAEERHGRWYAGYGTEEALDALEEPGGVDRRRRLERELDNMTAACRRAVSRGDSATAVAAYRASWTILEMRGPFGTGMELGREILGGLRLAPQERAHVLKLLGQGQWYSGMIPEARAHFEEARGISREIGDQRLESTILGSLGGVHLGQGEIGEAQANLEQALAVAREIGDRRSEGNILGNLGMMHRDQGRLAEALTALEAALAIHRELGHLRFEGTILGNLGLVLHDSQRTDEARAHYEAALRIHRQLGNRRFEAIVLGNLGNLHYHQGQMDRARSNYEAALASARAVGNRPFEGVVLFNLGRLHRDQGRMDQALELHEAALGIHRETGQRKFEGTVLSNLGFLYCDQGRIDEARDALTRGEAILRRVGDRLELGKLLCTWAALERGSGDPARAQAMFGEAEAIAAEIGVDIDLELEDMLATLRRMLAPT